MRWTLILSIGAGVLAVGVAGVLLRTERANMARAEQLFAQPIGPFLYPTIQGDSASKSARGTIPIDELIATWQAEDDRTLTPTWDWPADRPPHIRRIPGGTENSYLRDAVLVRGYDPELPEVAHAPLILDQTGPTRGSR